MKKARKLRSWISTRALDHAIGHFSLLMAAGVLPTYSTAQSLEETLEWISEKRPHFERMTYAFRTPATAQEWPKKAWLIDERITQLKFSSCRLFVVRQAEMQLRLEYSTTGMLEEFQRKNVRTERSMDSFTDEVDFRSLNIDPRLEPINPAATDQLDPPLWAIRFTAEPQPASGPSLARSGPIKFTNRELGIRVTSALKHLRNLCKG